MFQVSKSLRSKFYQQIGLNIYSHSAIQLVDKGRFIILYVCLVVHTDAKLQQAVLL